MAVVGQPVGKRLLQTMGWREGTGVGARVTADRKRRGAGGAGASGAAATAATAAGAPVSGAAGVAALLGQSLLADGGLDAATLGLAAGSRAVGDDGSSVTFAPDDAAACLPVPRPKSDGYGLGYDPLVFPLPPLTPRPPPTPELC